MGWFKKKGTPLNDIEFQKVDPPKKIDLYDEDLLKIGDFMGDAMKKMSMDIQHKKDEVLIARLKAKGIVLDPEEEQTRRFKRLMVSRDPRGHESWYYNDGSIDGLRIVTFIMRQEGLSDMGSTIKVEFDYH